MKIVIATDTYPPHVNGAAYFTRRLADTLVQHGHQVLVIAPSRRWRREKRLEQGVDILGISSLPLYINGVRVAVPWLAHWTMKKAIRSFKPDVIHIQGHFFLAHAVRNIGRQLGVPIVGTNHFMPDNLTHYVGINQTLETKIQNRMWQQCYDFFNSLDVVTTPTATAASLFTRYGFSKPVQAISNGIDLEKFNPRHSATPAQQTYKLPPAKPTALFVGRLDKEKHIDVLIKATAHALKQVEMHLVIAGSDKGGEARALHQLVQDLGITEHVTFTGFVPDDDLPALYQAADVFVIASTAELQSIATMEAMASGLPIIVANAVALPELVVPNVNGWLFEPGDVTTLSQYLVKILSDPQLAATMGQASRQQIGIHALESVVQQFEAIYQSLI